MSGQHESWVHGLMGWRTPCIVELKHLQVFLSILSTFGPWTLWCVHSTALMRRGPITGNNFTAENTGLRLPAHFTYRWALQSHQLEMAFFWTGAGSPEQKAVWSVMVPFATHPLPHTTPLCCGHPCWDTVVVHGGSSGCLKRCSLHRAPSEESVLKIKPISS